MNYPEARYYEKLTSPSSDSEKGAAVKCLLCPHFCRIDEGKTGICRVRRNEGGTLRSLIYNRISALHLDPIEKKPLYHFHPGREILSIDELVRQARDSGSVGIAFTYNEPSIWFEFVLDTARRFRSEGLKNVLVTNGFCNPEPWAEMLPWIDALNIDLKSIREEFYKRNCRARLEPVKKCIELAVRSCHVEITNLVIPRHNDSISDLSELIDYVASLGNEIPLHFSRYHPSYRFNEPPTSPDILQTAYELARRRLDYVYLGNLASEKGQNTYCPQCSSLLIRRVGYRTDLSGLVKNRCRQCNREIEVIV
ncbi:MAG: radical SAM protein [Proteobacteria bacterium]|nr:radical SAM protein [Pseudomonadota bacterium]